MTRQPGKGLWTYLATIASGNWAKPLWELVNNEMAWWIFPISVSRDDPIAEPIFRVTRALEDLFDD